MFDFDQNNWCHTSSSRSECKSKKKTHTTHNYDLFTLDVLTVVISVWYVDASGAIYATSFVRAVRMKIINSIALEIDFNYDSFAYDSTHAFVGIVSSSDLNIGNEIENSLKLMQKMWTIFFLLWWVNCDAFVWLITHGLDRAHLDRDSHFLSFNF